MPTLISQLLSRYSKALDLTGSAFGGSQQLELPDVLHPVITPELPQAFQSGISAGVLTDSHLVTGSASFTNTAGQQTASLQAFEGGHWKFDLMMQAVANFALPLGQFFALQLVWPNGTDVSNVLILLADGTNPFSKILQLSTELVLVGTQPIQPQQAWFWRLSLPGTGAGQTVQMQAYAHGHRLA